MQVAAFFDGILQLGQEHACACAELRYVMMIAILVGAPSQPCLLLDSRSESALDSKILTQMPCVVAGFVLILKALLQTGYVMAKIHSFYYFLFIM
jgi:hypothetical protein